MTPAAEQVLVVARNDHFDGRWHHGFRRVDDDSAGRDLLARFERTARFVPRPAAEADRSLKQLIPYCALRCGDRVLCVERLAAQGERRLHGRRSIGIGGHINPVDRPDEVSGRLQGVVRKALARELTEEVSLPVDAEPGRARLLGLINDDTTDVGSVHVGLAFVLDLTEAQAAAVKVREISKMRGTFRRLVGSDGVWQDPPLLESWSRFMVGEFAVGMADSESRTQLEGDG